MEDKTSKSINQFLSKYNSCQIIESILPPRDKIVAIGDIHGDLDALIKALIKSQVIDENDINKWTGGDACVVQVGDIFDRGGRGSEHGTHIGLEEIKILDFLYELNKKAQPYGGKVISLIGNHELMNILGDFRYASKEHIAGMGGYQNRKRLLEPGGPLARRIACNSLGIVQIGDWIFVHGGLLPEHINNDLSSSNKANKDIIYQINHLVREIILGNISVHDITPTEEKILFGGNGIFWTREYSSHRKNPERCSTILKTLDLLNIDKKKGGIVVGHTPQNNINSVCDNKIWRIDTGMSNAFGKRNNYERIEVLIILNNGGAPENFIVI